MQHRTLDQALEAIRARNFRFFRNKGRVAPPGISLLGYDEANTTPTLQRLLEEFNELRRRYGYDHPEKVYPLPDLAPSPDMPRLEAQFWAQWVWDELLRTSDGASFLCQELRCERYVCALEYEPPKKKLPPEDVEKWDCALWVQPGTIKTGSVSNFTLAAPFKAFFADPEGVPSAVIFRFQEIVRYRVEKVEAAKYHWWSGRTVRPDRFEWRPLTRRTDECTRLHTFIQEVAQRVSEEEQRFWAAKADRERRDRQADEDAGRKARDEFWSADDPQR